MKLFTCCGEKEATIYCTNNEWLTLQEYSYQDYLRFINESKSYHIKEFHDWYQTDMNDSDSGSTTKRFSINQTNMVIKNGKFYGVLVNSNPYFPKYFLVSLAQKKYYYDFDGGYNTNSFEWTFIENDLINTVTLDVSTKYLLIIESISYEFNESRKRLISYLRSVIGLTQNNCVVENDKVIGVKYNQVFFDFKKPESFVYRQIKESESSNNQSNVVYSLVEITKEHLEKNIFDVSYEDFRNNKFELYTILD